MKSFTQYQSRIPDIINNSQGTNLIWATEIINDSNKYLIAKYYFNERDFTIPGGTVSGQQFYNLPPQIKKVITVLINVGGVNWQPVEAATRSQWNKLNVITTFKQDFPSHFFIFNGQIGFFPIPSTTGNAVTISYKARISELSQGDVSDTSSGATVFTPFTATTTLSPTTGSTTFTLSNVFGLAGGTYAVTFANPNQDVKQVFFTMGSTAAFWTGGLSGTATTTQTIRTSAGADFISITGGTLSTFNKWMAQTGWIRIPSNTIDTANGDNQWYQIASYGTQTTTGTTIALTNQYAGSSVTAGKFTIGDMSILPEDYQDLPLYRMAEIYYTTRFPDPTKAQLYQGLWEKGVTALDEEFSTKTSSIILPEIDSPTVNPNLFQRSISQN